MRTLLAVSFLSLFVLVGFGQSVDELIRRGKVFMDHSELESAINAFNAAEKKCGGKCSVRTMQLIALHKGIAYKVNEQYPEASDAYSKAINLASKIDDDDIQAYTKIHLAEYYRAAGNLTSSLVTLNEIKREYNIDLLSKRTQLEYYSRSAAVVNQIGNDFIQVEKDSWKAYTIAKELDDKHMMATSLNEIGYVVEHYKDRKSAVQYYLQSIELWSDYGQIRYAANAYNNLSRLYAREGEYDSSLYYADKGIELIDTTVWHTMLADLYLNKIVAHQGLKEYKEMSDAYYRYHNEVMEARSRDWSDKMAKVSSELKLEENSRLLRNAIAKRDAIQEKLKQNEVQQSFLMILLILALITSGVVVYFVFRMRKNNKELTNSIHERDMLLKEVHHRVKNNMQVVSSLLDLQSSFAKDEISKMALVDSRDRINSLALAHQNLYTDEQYDQLEIKNYLERLIQSILPKNVISKIVIDEGHVDIDKAQALGFVVNELVTNSVKHAWNKQTEDRLIWIKLIFSDGEWHFYYADNGVGISNKVEFLESPTFGITLMRSFLRRSLKGTIEFGEKPGMNIAFKFK